MMPAFEGCQRAPFSQLIGKIFCMISGDARHFAVSVWDNDKTATGNIYPILLSKQTIICNIRERHRDFHAARACMIKRSMVSWVVSWVVISKPSAALGNTAFTKEGIIHIAPAGLLPL